MPLWARVGDGDFAARQLAKQLTHKTFPNLFDKCGPFQADGNFGATAGIVEMLLQSHQVDADGVRIVDLLPALPKCWPSGNVKGLCGRGGLVIDSEWRDGAVVNATIRATVGGTFTLRSGEQRKDVTIKVGESIRLNEKLERVD
jgi:alpha-L-fucosidase 2